MTQNHLHDGDAGSSAPIRVLLADDQTLIVAALTTILESQGDITVVATAATGAETVKAAQENSVDLAVLDIRMPDGDGIDAAAAMSRLYPQMRILMLTTFDDEELVSRALRVGVQGFLLKDAGPEGLIDAVRRVHAGASVLSPEVTGYVIEAFRQSERRGDEAMTLTDRSHNPLTPREADVLAGVARAETNAEIAAHLFIGEETVKTYVSRLLAKLGARDRVGLVVRAYESGLTGPR
jgi:DNA-binding NarL/FixJ family response regulator